MHIFLLCPIECNKNARKEGIRLQGVFDLHCDTLTEGSGCCPCYTDTLNRFGCAFRLSAIPPQLSWGQLFAIFIREGCQGQAAWDTFYCHYTNFVRQVNTSPRMVFCTTASALQTTLERHGIAALVTVENGSVLGGNLKNIPRLSALGVRLLTLVWNGENELGSGYYTDHGLSPLGREAIPLLEKHHIIIDASHLNDQGTEELFALAKKPFVLSHSNLRSVADQSRNTPDCFVRELIARDGLLGLTFHAPFLGITPEENGVIAFARHLEHALSLGAENHLALGSDFDGSTLPSGLTSLSQEIALYPALRALGFSETVLDKLFYTNALRFFSQNLP